MVASPRHHKRSAVVAGPLNERTNSHPTGSGKSTAVVPTAERSSSTSLRIELQQEQISALMCELDQLQAQLTDARVASTSAESVHAGERGELVASYERMLSEQAAAVRQYEARAACVGSLRLEARKRESELAAVRQESVAVRQRLTVVTKVWRQSVIEVRCVHPLSCIHYQDNVPVHASWSRPLRAICRHTFIHECHAVMHKCRHAHMHPAAPALTPTHRHTRIPHELRTCTPGTPNLSADIVHVPRLGLYPVRPILYPVRTLYAQPLAT